MSSRSCSRLPKRPAPLPPKSRRALLSTAIAADRKLTEKDIDLGTVAKSDMLDKTIADAAFSLPEGGVSDPIKTRFGVALIHVAKIIPENVKPFADVAAALKDEIAADRAKATVNSIHDKIEDERTSGKALADAAKTVGLDVTTIDAVDATGHDKSGAELPNLPDRDALLRAAFASDIGVDNDTLSTRDGGYVWYEVAGIEPAHDRTLDEVKDEVTKDWHDDQVTSALASKAADLVKEIDAGETVEAAAAAAGGFAGRACQRCQAQRRRRSAARRRRANFQRAGRCGGLGCGNRPHARRLQGARQRRAAARSRIRRIQDR